MKSLGYRQAFLITLVVHVISYQRDPDARLQQLESCHHQLHSCVSESPNTYCSCERDCIYYDDCCFDAKAITENEDQISGKVHHQFEYLEMTTCENISFKENTFIRQGVFMVSSCPVTWDSNIDTRRSCELDINYDIRDMLPVLDLRTKLTFKNRHCAKCNRVQNYVPWLMEMTCLTGLTPPSHSVIEVLMMKMHSDKCRYRFIPPSDIIAPIHYCFEEFDYAIIQNTSERVLNSTCQNRVFKPVCVKISRKPDVFYRNLQCLTVNNVSIYLDAFENLYCVVNNKKKYSDYITLTSLIDFSSMLRIAREFQCREEEIELSAEVGCQRLYCPAPSEPSGGRCVGIEHTTNNVMLDLLFEVDGELDIKNFVFLRILDKLITTLSNDKGILHLLAGYSDTINYIPGTFLNSGNACTIIHVLLPLEYIIRPGVTIDTQRLLIANLLKNNTLTSPNGSVMKPIANVQNMSCYSNTSVRNPSYLLELLSVEKGLPCPAVKVQYGGNASDSSLTGTDVVNGTTDDHFHLNGIVISPSDVVFANEDFFLCIDTFSSKYRRDDQEDELWDDYRGIINMVCSALSVTCLVYFLVQYCAIPSLRDGKSDLIIVLASLLLLAQILFLLMQLFTLPTHECTWFGMVNHSLWLYSFTFMFLCSFRLNAEIRSLKNYSKSERVMTTVRYMLVGFSVPTFLVLCTKITNLFLDPMTSWYGGRVCFISKTIVLLITFVVPILLMLCGNVVLFICIIHYISSTNLSTSNKSNIIVFIKISTMMGLSWIIGIIAIFSHSDILLLVFEILSNLQGTFITISFSCTNRVRKFYKDCAIRKKNDSSITLQHFK